MSPALNIKVEQGYLDILEAFAVSRKLFKLRGRRHGNNEQNINLTEAFRKAMVLIEEVMIREQETK